MPGWLVLDSYFIADGVIRGGHKPLAGGTSVEEVHQSLGASLEEVHQSLGASLGCVLSLASSSHTLSAS